MISNRGASRTVLIALVALVAGLILLWRFLGADSGAPEPTPPPKNAVAPDPVRTADPEAEVQDELSSELVDDPNDPARASEANVPTFAEVVGSVTDAGGKPIERATIAGLDPEQAAARMRKPLVRVTARRKTGPRFEATLDAQGGYRFAKLVRGKWTIEASAQGHETARAVLVVDGRQPQLKHDFQLAARRMLDVRVRVTNAEPAGAEQPDLVGAPLAVRLSSDAAVVVSVKPLENCPRPLAIDGEPILDVASFGTAERVAPDWIYTWKLGAPIAGSVSVNLVLGETVLETRATNAEGGPVSFELDAARVMEGLASLEVHVVDATSDKGLAGVEVRVRRPKPSYDDALLDERVLEVTRSAADGGAKLVALSPGSATLSFRAAGYEPLDVPVTLVAGKATALAAVRMNGAVSIQGRVVDAQGKAVAARVRCVRDGSIGSGGSEPTRTVLASAETGFELRELGRHSYFVVAETADGRIASARAVDTTKGNVQGLDLALESGQKVDFEITRGVTQPFELEVADAHGIALFHRASSGATTLSLTLPKGAYEVLARFQGKVLASRKFEVDASATQVRLDVP